MKNLFLATVLSFLVCGQALAYEQINTCSNGRSTNVTKRQESARAFDKRTKINVSTSYSNSAPQPQKSFEKMWMYRDWVLGQLNAGTLLRDQIAAEIENINNIHSTSNWVIQKEKDSSPCRQLVFSESDIQPLGFIWTGSNELLVSFNVLMTDVESRRDEGTLYGYRFNMKLSITQEYTKQNYPVVTSTTVLEYPQFISKNYGSYPEQN
jgi:hypothetical protein